MPAGAAQSVPGPGFTRLILAEPPYSPPHSTERAAATCRELELGNIIFFPKSPVVVSEAQLKSLFSPRASSSARHKNIAYRPWEDRLTGINLSSQFADIHEVLCNFSHRCIEFLSQALHPYATQWTLDYASYRPTEEEGRPNRLHARNDLLHFDSFPSRPTHGSRILRFFININPARDRVWVTSGNFESSALHFLKHAWLRSVFPSPFERRIRSLLASLGVRGASRSSYDQLMHRCHNAMKEDAAYQASTPKFQWQFPPGSAWMAFTDCVSHSVISGQFALEETFLVPQSALVEPSRSPLAILERWAGRSLI